MVLCVSPSNAVRPVLCQGTILVGGTLFACERVVHYGRHSMSGSTEDGRNWALYWDEEAKDFPARG